MRGFVGEAGGLGGGEHFVKFIVVAEGECLEFGQLAQCGDIRGLGREIE